MSIPEFDEFGLLPAGTFPATKVEIQERYCSNPNRRDIWDRFLIFCEQELLPNGWSNILLVDGGFTSDKPHTKDIDVVLDVSAQPIEKVYEAFFWQLGNYARIKETYLTDFWVFHPAFPSDLTAYFRYIKEEERILRGAPTGHTKGLLRLEI